MISSEGVREWSWTQVLEITPNYYSPRDATIQIDEKSCAELLERL
jgi:hypothetical protein